MANIPNSSLKTWNDGDTVHAVDYSQDRSILQTAINDNYAKLILKYDKTDVDNLLNAMKGTGWTTETIKANHDLILSIQTDIANIQTQTTNLATDGSNFTGKWYNMLPSQIATSTVNWFEKQWTAIDGQTVFQLTGSDTLYTPGSETTWLMVGGVPQSVGQGYTETDNKTITTAEGVSGGTLVEMRYFLNNAASETSITNMVGFQENVAAPLAEKARQTDVDFFKTRTQYTSRNMGGGQPSQSLYAQAEKKEFELRSLSDFDATINVKGTLGELQPSTSGSVGKVVRSFEVGTINNFSIQCEMYYDGTQGSLFVGYTSSQPGVLPTSEYVMKVGFNHNGFEYYNGADNVLVAPSGLTTGWYIVSIFNLAGGSVAISLQKETDTKAQSWVITDTTSPIYNVYGEVYNASDKIKHFRYAAITNTNPNLLIPMFVNKKNFHTGIQMNVSGVNTIAHIPANYNPSMKNKCVIFFHGSNGAAKDLWNYANENSILQGLLDAGYVVIASDYTSKTCWGNTQSQTDIDNLITHYKTYLNIEDKFYLVVESMGGITGFNAIAHCQNLNIYNVNAIIGIYPTCNLEALYDNGNGQLSADIATAYGITDPTQFQSKTDGYDPLNDNDGTGYARIPMLFWSSYGDTVVPRTTNEDEWATKMNGLGGNIVINTSTGDHGDASNFHPDQVVAFLDKY